MISLEELYHYFANDRALLFLFDREILPVPQKGIIHLKSDFFIDNLAGRSYQVNGAMMQLAVITYNLFLSLQIETGIAKVRAKNVKTTRCYQFMKMKTFRFKVIYKAGKIGHHNGKKILYLTENRATEKLFEEIQQGLAKIA